MTEITICLPLGRILLYASIILLAGTFMGGVITHYLARRMIRSLIPDLEGAIEDDAERT